VHGDTIAKRLLGSAGHFSLELKRGISNILSVPRRRHADRHAFAEENPASPEEAQASL
jgi:hypothetical protein